MRQTVLTLLSLLLSPVVFPAASARAGEAELEAEPAPASVRVAPHEPLEAPTAPRAPALPPERGWYGWQIMLADAASFFCIGATETEACVAGLALSGPVVHTLHGRPARGIVSLGLRVGLPVIGAVIGASTANCPDRSPPVTTTREVDGGTITTTTGDWSLCGLSEIGFGALAGLGAAMVADGFMAITSGAPAAALEPAKPTRFALAPRLAVGPNNVAMGLGGTF